MTSKSKLKLYIAGWTPKFESAISNLYSICDEQLDGQYEIEVIDILERPQLAKDEKIMATSTLIKELPGIIQRIISDLSDSEKSFWDLKLFSYDCLRFRKYTK